MKGHTPRVSFFSDITVFSLGDYEIGPSPSGRKTHVWIDRISIDGKGFETSKEKLYTAIHDAIEKYFTEEDSRELTGSGGGQ